MSNLTVLNTGNGCRNIDEELIRRRRNYTKPYMQGEENITWICSPLWQFERKEYERMVEDYRKVYEDRMGRD